MKKEFIFENPPFQECHASTIVELRDGRIMTAWFGGTKEGHADVAIWGAWRGDYGWSPPRLLAKVNELPHWNPVLFRGKDTPLYLFFKVGKNCAHWRTYVMQSLDCGGSWSEPTQLIPGNIGGRGPTKNKCIELANGDWLAPASSEIGWWQAFVDRSCDQGRTWQRSALIKMPKTIVGKNVQGQDVRFGVIQPTLWESMPGHVHMLLRSSANRICRSDSTDGGQSWSKVFLTSLPNNNSGVDMVRLKDGILLLAFNPVGQNWGARNPLSLIVSPDNGATWFSKMDIDIGKQEYSYPAIISTSDGGAAISYTWDRKGIVYVRISPAELEDMKKCERSYLAPSLKPALDSQGFVENHDSARKGGKIAGDARKKLEKESSMKVVAAENYLDVPQSLKELKSEQE